VAEGLRDPQASGYDGILGRRCKPVGDAKASQGEPPGRRVKGSNDESALLYNHA
jgi:hypothetical protein